MRMAAGKDRVLSEHIALLMYAAQARLGTERGRLMRMAAGKDRVLSEHIALLMYAAQARLGTELGRLTIAKGFWLLSPQLSILQVDRFQPRLGRLIFHRTQCVLQSMKSEQRTLEASWTYRNPQEIVDILRLEGLDFCFCFSYQFFGQDRHRRLTDGTPFAAPCKLHKFSIRELEIDREVITAA